MSLFRPVLRAGAAATLAALLAVPAVATAGTLSHADPAKDVQKVTAAGSGTTVTDAPAAKNGDVVRLTAKYGTQRLLEKVHLRRLSGLWLMSSRIMAGTHRYDLTLIHQAGSTQASLTKGKGQTAVVCDGLVPAFDRAGHTISATVPADCLANPAAVRIGVGVVRFGRAGGVSYADDALRRRGVQEPHLTLSKKLHQH